MSNLIRVCTYDNFEVDYDDENGVYRVTVFKDGHYWDEVSFEEFKQGTDA